MLSRQHKTKVLISRSGSAAGEVLCCSKEKVRFAHNEAHK